MTKNSIAAAAAPAQANPARRSFFRSSPVGHRAEQGKSTADNRVEAVIVYDGRRARGDRQPEHRIRLSTAASLAIAIR